jgi:hypothetical protein
LRQASRSHEGPRGNHLAAGTGCGADSRASAVSSCVYYTTDSCEWERIGGEFAEIGKFISDRSKKTEEINREQRNWRVAKARKMQIRCPRPLTNTVDEVAANVAGAEAVGWGAMPGEPGGETPVGRSGGPACHLKAIDARRVRARAGRSLLPCHESGDILEDRRRQPGLADRVKTGIAIKIVDDRGIESYKVLGVDGWPGFRACSTERRCSRGAEHLRRRQPNERLQRLAFGLQPRPATGPCR